MASLAETLGAKGIQQNPIAADIQAGVQTGVQLATMADQVEQKKIQTKAMQEQLNTAKFNKAVGSLQTLARTNPQIAKKLVPRISQNLQEAGIAVDPLILESIASDDEFKRRINSSANIFSGMAKSEGAMQEGLSALNDFGMFEEGLNALAANQKLEIQEKAANARLDRQLNAIQRSANKDESKAISESKKSFDSAIKDDLDALSQANKAEGLLSAGGTISGEAAKSTIARMFEKGVLTDADINRLSGGRSLYDRGNQLAQTLVDGKLSGENQRELLRIVKTLKPLLAEKIKTRAERDAEAQASIWPNIPKERFVEAYNINSLLGPSTGPAKSAIDTFRANAKAAGYTDEQIEAEIQKRTAGQ